MNVSTAVEPEQDESRKVIPSHAIILGMLVLIPSIVQAKVYARLLFQYIFVHNDTAYPEGASVYAFLTALRTGHLYTEPFHFPWNVQLYGPIFYLVGLGLAKAAHGVPLLTTELVRGLSFLAFTGAVGLAAYLSWRLERNKIWTMACVVMGFACTWAIPYVASARPESLAFFMIFAAMTVFEVAQGRGKVIFWAGVLGSLSFLTKQSTAPVLFALLLYTLLERRFKNTVALVLGTLPVPILVYSVLSFRHEDFLANFAAIGHAVIDWRGVPKVFLDLLRTNQAAVIPLLIMLMGAIVSWKIKKYQPIILTAVLGCVTGVAALSNVGGAGHYLILPWLLLVPFLPAGMLVVEGWARRTHMIPVGLAALGVILLIHQRNLLAKTVPADIDVSGVSQLKILSDLGYLEMNSREPELLDPYYYRNVALRNVWSFAPIAAQIDRQEFDLILIGGEDGKSGTEFTVSGFRGVSYWGAHDLDDMQSHYRGLCEVPGYLAFVPRERAGSVRGEDVQEIFRKPCRQTDRIPHVERSLR